MASNATSARESRRRRKIMDRGADRLALISGRIQSLPPQPSDSPVPLSSQPSDSSVSPASEDGSLGSTSSNRDSAVTAPFPPPPAAALEPIVSESAMHNYVPASKGGTIASMLSDTNDPVINSPPVSARGPIVSERTSSNVDVLESRVPEVRHHVQPASRVSRVENLGPSTTVMRRLLDFKMRLNEIVTPGQITSAFAATEENRLHCSVVVAVVVVLSHWGFPLLGSSIIKGVVSFRPLFLVLLTNVTLVAWWIMLDNQRGSGRSVRRQYTVSPSGGYDWAEQAGNALEIALAMQKAIDAMFMDCSIYVVILICGLCVFR